MLCLEMSSVASFTIHCDVSPDRIEAALAVPTRWPVKLSEDARRKAEDPFIPYIQKRDLLLLEPHDLVVMVHSKSSVSKKCSVRRLAVETIPSNGELSFHHGGGGGRDEGRIWIGGGSVVVMEKAKGRIWIRG
jgi:hypothetical protein